jgi:hypothetical protein
MKPQAFRLLAISVAVVFALLTSGAVNAQTPPTPPKPELPPDPSAEFFNSAHVRDLKLFINSKDWANLQENYLSNTFYPCDLHWEGQIARNVGCRSRGRGSRLREKPGLKVDIDFYSTKQAFLGMTSFVLDNLSQDPSTLREVAIMAFFARMGQPASREAFVRLWVNNQYLGLYAVAESINKLFLRRNFGQIEEDWEDDGYLYEYDYKADYKFEYLGSDLEKYEEIWDPKTHENASKEKKWRYFEELTRLVHEVPDQDFAAIIGQRLDLMAFTKHLALENFVAELDGFVGYAGMNNFYFYRMEHTGLGRPIVWDKDVAFHSVDFPLFHRIDENTLARRVLAIPEMRALYLNTLEQAAHSANEPEPPPETSNPGQSSLNDDPEQPKPGWLEREVRRLYTLVQPFVHADTNKPYSNERFEDEIVKVLELARQRPGWVLNEVKNEYDKDKDKK